MSVLYGIPGISLKTFCGSLVPLQGQAADLRSGDGGRGFGVSSLALVCRRACISMGRSRNGAMDRSSVMENSSGSRCRSTVPISTQTLRAAMNSFMGFLAARIDGSGQAVVLCERDLLGGRRHVRVPDGVALRVDDKEHFLVGVFFGGHEEILLGLVDVFVGSAAAEDCDNAYHAFGNVFVPIPKRGNDDPFMLMAGAGALFALAAARPESKQFRIPVEVGFNQWSNEVGIGLCQLRSQFFDAFRAAVLRISGTQSRERVRFQSSRLCCWCFL